MGTEQPRHRARSDGAGQLVGEAEASSVTGSDSGGQPYPERAVCGGGPEAACEGSRGNDLPLPQHDVLPLNGVPNIDPAKFLPPEQARALRALQKLANNPRQFTTRDAVIVFIGVVAFDQLVGEPGRPAKEEGQHYEELDEAQRKASKRRPKTKGPDADPEWEGGPRPEQNKIKSKGKSKQRDLTPHDPHVERDDE